MTPKEAFTTFDSFRRSMLNPATITFDNFNTWAQIWYVPTHRELYIMDYGGNMVAKYCFTYRGGEWPMWISECIANVADARHKPAIDSIVHAWEERVFDLVDTIIQSQRRSAIWDE